jgi:hypothetical protein
MGVPIFFYEADEGFVSEEEDFFLYSGETTRDIITHSVL